MRWLRRSGFGLVFGLLAYAATILLQQKTAPPSPSSSQVLSAATGIGLFVEPQDGRQPILNAITSAQKQILVEVYELTDKQILNALIEEKAKGIAVKVMLEHHPFGSEAINDQAEQTLQSAGVAVQWTNPAFALTHEKDIIIDNNELFVLNQNLTASSFSRNREYDIVDDNKQDIAEAEQIFTDDWQRQNFHPTDSHLIISPVNSRAGLTALLNQATKTIDIEIEDIDDPQIVQLLSQKAKTVQIRIITPTLSQISSNKDALETLQAAGVQVRTISSPYIHAKLILADSQMAYVGSVNLSTQSMDKNRELGIIFSQSASVQNLATDFETDWQEASNLH